MAEDVFKDEEIFGVSNRTIVPTKEKVQKHKKAAKLNALLHEYDKCYNVRKFILFLRIGFYTFYMPYLEKRHGLKELFDTLSNIKKPCPCDSKIIRDYVHTWLGIKGLFKPQHCWNRTLLLYKFLKSAGYNVELYTGIRKDGINKSSLIGHSWVTIDGKIFDDNQDVAHEHYITFHYPWQNYSIH